MPTYLLTWNPQSWPWDDLADEARRLRQGKALEGRWGCGNSRSIKPGDRFFFLRQGPPPRGIIASGRITSAPRPGKHWDPEKRKKGVLARYVHLRFEVLLDPEQEAPLGVAELTRGPLAQVHWRTQISGIRIADDAAALLEKLWVAHVAGQRASVPDAAGDRRGRLRPRFKLSLPARDVRTWAARYDASVDLGLAEVGRRARGRGYLTGKDLRTLARWKTPRTAAHVARNEETVVRAVTRVAFATECEGPRIEALMLLRGVGWPTASVILHFVYPDRYPIVDYRALSSVGVSPAPPYSFEFWDRYLEFTRATARRLGVSMRELDRALWQYSKNA